MIEQYVTGSYMTVGGQAYHQDLKIVGGQVKGNWWRREGHRVDTRDIQDILAAKPRVLVVGTGYAGNLRVPASVRSALENKNIQLIAERTSEAAQTFNRLRAQGEKVAGAFHLTC